VSLASRYESSSDCTNSPWYEQSRRVRTVQGTNSPRYEKSRYLTNNRASYASSDIATAEMSVRLSVRPSHFSIVSLSKRTKLASWYLHRPRDRTPFGRCKGGGNDLKHIGVTTLTFQCHVTLSITWPFLSIRMSFADLLWWPFSSDSFAVSTPPPLVWRYCH